MLLTILGCGSSTPSLWRNPSSQIIKIRESTILLDCGEGTTVQLLKNKIKYHSIDIVLISHLHGDHFSGLYGLISAMNSARRLRSLYIYGPQGLAEIISTQCFYSKLNLNFEINFHITSNLDIHLLMDSYDFKIQSFPLNHRVDCTGFLIEEKHDNSTKKYAYCTDTLADTSYLKFIKGVDLLYHEATFESSMLKWAIQTKHTTSEQAADTAKYVDAKKLIIGHFSSRYTNVDVLVEEARKIFANTFEAIEGDSYLI